MSVLMINAERREQIKAAVEKARQNVIPWETLKTAVPKQDEPSPLLKLEDRVDGLARPISENLIFDDYRMAISFEEQPAGLVRHFSISVHPEKPKVTPNIEVVMILAREFGFEDIDRIWLEEFEPDTFAVNVVELIK